MTIGKKDFNFRISVPWIIAIIMIGLALIGAFAYVDAAKRPLLIFITAVFGGCAALITAGNAVEGRAAALERDRKAMALTLAREWTHPSMFTARSHGSAIMKYFREHPHANDQTQFLDAEEGRRTALFDVLNVLESLAIAVNCELVDEQLAKRFFRSIVLGYWNATQQWVKAYRAERENPRLYTELADLFNRWKA